MGEYQAPICICGVLTSIALLLIVILVPMHFSYVDINNLGLRKATTSGEVDTDQAYTTGRYGWGVTKTALNFENTWRRVSFSGSTATRVFTDAGEITIGVAFYYVLTKEGLPRTFEAFAKNYDAIIRKQALDAIKNTASNFTTIQYQSQRSNISRLMHGALNATLSSLVHVAVPYEGFYLSEIVLPTSVLTKRIESFEQEQQQVTQGFQLRNQQYRLATAQNVSRIDREVDVVRSQSTVTAQGLRDAARNRARADKQREAGVQLQAMVNALGINASSNATRKLVKYNAMLDFTRGVTILDSVIGRLFA
jgi:hypothetical protein